MAELNFTKEQLAQLRQAGTPQELQAILADFGVELTALQAEDAWKKYLGNSELSDAELENVAGGGCGGGNDDLGSKGPLLF